jgi:hypothetical protein
MFLKYVKCHLYLLYQMSRQFLKTQTYLMWLINLNYQQFR